MKNDKEIRIYRLRTVADDLRFFCRDGRVFASLDELCAGLAEMEPAVFNYHSNGGKSDFACWTRDVFGDQELADRLWQVREKKSSKIYQILNDYLDESEPAGGSYSRKRKNYFLFS